MIPNNASGHEPSGGTAGSGLQMASSESQVKVKEYGKPRPEQGRWTLYRRDWN